MKFRAGKKDSVGGDINAVGQTVSKMNLDKRMLFGLSILTFVAKTFPSEWAQQKEEMQKVMEPILGR